MGDLHGRLFGKRTDRYAGGLVSIVSVKVLRPNQHKNSPISQAMHAIRKLNLHQSN